MFRINKILGISFLFIMIVALFFCMTAADGEEGSPLVIDNPYHHGYPLKGQIHAHTDESGDGYYSPKEVVLLYKYAGYDFICLTDHNQATILEEPVGGIVVIPSGEDGYGDRHHILALGINFDLLNSDVDEDLDGLDDRPTGPCENNQPRIDYIALTQKTVAVLAHPTHSHEYDGEGWLLEELITLKNYTGIEIYNAGKECVSTPEKGNWWDDVLRSGKKIWGFAGDDFHLIEPGSDSGSFNDCWIVVNAEKNIRYGDSEGEVRNNIIKNMLSGNFYTVVHQSGGIFNIDVQKDKGPELNISVSGQTISIYTNIDRQSRIKFIFGVGESIIKNATHSEYTVDGSERYVRIEVYQTHDHGQYIAFSQPLFIRNITPISCAVTNN